MTRSFSYARSLSPSIWVLMALSVVELCVIHLLVALLWSKWVALGLTLVTLAGIGWLAMLVRSFARLPVEVGGERVVMRVGMVRSVSIAVSDIAGLRASFTGQDVKARAVLNLALLAYPNVLLDLKEAVRIGRRSIGAVAHRLDDPAGFAAAIEEVRRAAAIGR